MDERRRQAELDRVKAEAEAETAKAEAETAKANARAVKAEAEAREQKKRQRAIALAVGILMMAVVGGSIAWWEDKQATKQRADDEQKKMQQVTHAAGLVQRVLDADTAQVPGVIAEMTEYRQWTDPLLRQANEQAAAQSRQKLRTSLALLPIDLSQMDYLSGRLLDAAPQEVLVIRDALAPHKDELLDKLWAIAEKPEKGKETQRLRAAAALAKYDPESERWDKVSALVVNDLVLENPILLGQWSEAFRPVKNRLLPRLSEIFRDHQPERTVERNLATSILTDYAADQPQTLADLVMDADESNCRYLSKV